MEFCVQYTTDSKIMIHLLLEDPVEIATFYARMNYMNDGTLDDAQDIPQLPAPDLSIDNDFFEVISDNIVDMAEGGLI